jgi:hypothetical protein
VWFIRLQAPVAARAPRETWPQLGGTWAKNQAVCSFLSFPFPARWRHDSAKRTRLLKSFGFVK